MSKNLMSIPVGTALMQTPTQVALPWQKYLKAIGDDLLTANKAVNDSTTKDFKYVINANICFFTYYASNVGVSDIAITLPYTALLAFDVDGVVYVPGTKIITILANTAYVHGWYVCNFDNLAKTAIV